MIPTLGLTCGNSAYMLCPIQVSGAAFQDQTGYFFNVRVRIYVGKAPSHGLVQEVLRNPEP